MFVANHSSHYGHAGDPARAARAAGAGARRWPPRPTTSTPSGGWAGPCRCSSAPCRWRATAAASTTTRPPTSRSCSSSGWSLVMFAEGTRSRDGSVGKLRSGAAVLAAQHDLALVPIHVSGSHDVMPVGRYWPKFQPGFKRHPVEISFGAADPAAGRRSTAPRSWSACASTSSTPESGPHLRHGRQRVHRRRARHTVARARRRPRRARALGRERRRRSPRAGSRSSAATCSTRTRSPRGWRAATSSSTAQGSTRTARRTRSCC